MLFHVDLRFDIFISLKERDIITAKKEIEVPCPHNTSCYRKVLLKVSIPVNIQGSYICDSALISQNCEIKNSIIGSEIQVEEGQKHINEIVATDNSRMMEI